MNIESLAVRCTERLKQEEGCCLRPYRDTRDLLTIGWGWCLDRSPMRMSEAQFRLDNDVAEEIALGIKYIPGFSAMSETRQSVFVDMLHQLGLAGLMGFRRMIEAVRASDWAGAAAELLDSKYAREDSPSRAHRNERLLEEG